MFFFCIHFPWIYLDPWVGNQWSTILTTFTLQTKVLMEPTFNLEVIV